MFRGAAKDRGGRGRGKGEAKNYESYYGVRRTRRVSARRRESRDRSCLAVLSALSGESDSLMYGVVARSKPGAIIQ